MPRRSRAEGRQTYLVEHYRPGLGVDGLRQCAARVRDTAVEMERAGSPVRHVRSTIVPADESLFCVFEAASEELVRQTYKRAGVPFERLSAVIVEADVAAATAVAAEGQSPAPRQPGVPQTEREESS
jgi:Nickel responsive protein SCO4226-like